MSSRGISISGTGDEGKSQIAEIIEKCSSEISESPESFTAFFACNLMSTVIVKTNKPLEDYVLKNFLLEKIVDPLIEGVDEHMHHGHVHSELGR